MKRSERRDAYARKIAAQHDGLRLDANETAVLARELEAIDNRMFEVKYHEHMALSILPMNTQVDETAKKYTYQVVSGVGQASRINNYATDFHRSDVSAVEYSSTIVTYGTSYGYSIEELNAAAKMRVPIPTWRQKFARDALDEKIETLLWFGDSAAGVMGLANNSVVDDNLVTLVNGGWIAEADPLKVLADMNKFANASSVASAGIEISDTFIFPESFKDKLTTTPISSTQPTMTIMSVFKMNSPNIKNIYFSPRLETADAAGTGPRAICFKKDSDIIEGILPLAFDQTSPHDIGWDWEIKMRAKCGGVVIRYPAAVQYCDAI